MTAEYEPDSQAHTPVDEVDEIPHIAFFEQARRPLPEDDCAERACKALAELGYEGLRDEEATAEFEPEDQTAAWKRKLENEGKLRPQASAVGRRVVDAARLD